MKTTLQDTLVSQQIKRQRLTREFSWITREFRDFHALEDLELDNVDRFIRLHLGYNL